MHSFAAQPRVRDGIIGPAGLEGQHVGATARPEVTQTAAFAKEAASLGGVQILGAELGHAVV